MVTLWLFLVACVAPFTPRVEEVAAIEWQEAACEGGEGAWSDCAIPDRLPAATNLSEEDGLMPFANPRSGAVVEWEGSSWLVTTAPWSLGVQCVALHAASGDVACPWDFSLFAQKSMMSPVRVRDALILTEVTSSPLMSLLPALVGESDDEATFNGPASLTVHEFDLATGIAEQIAAFSGENAHCVPYGAGPVDVTGDGLTEVVYRLVGRGSCPVPYLEWQNGEWVQRMLPHASGGAQYGVYGFWLEEQRFWVLGDIKDQTCFTGVSLLNAEPVACPTMASDWMGLALIDEGVGRPSLLTPDIGALRLCRYLDDGADALDSCYESAQASGLPVGDPEAEGRRTYWDMVVADFDGDTWPEAYVAASYDHRDETWGQNLGAWRLGVDLLWTAIEDPVFATPAHERGLGLWAPPGFDDPVLIAMPVSGVSPLRMLAPPLSDMGRIQTRIVDSAGEPDCGARVTVVYAGGEGRQFFPFCANGSGLQVPAAVFTPPDATLRVRWSNGAERDVPPGGIAAP